MVRCWKFKKTSVFLKNPIISFIVFSLFLFGCSFESSDNFDNSNTFTPEFILKTEFDRIEINEGESFSLNVLIEEKINPENSAEYMKSLEKSFSVRWTILSGENEFNASQGDQIINDSSTSLTLLINPIKDLVLDGEQTYTLRIIEINDGTSNELEIPIVVFDQTSPANLVFSNDPEYDFGIVSIETTSEVTLTLTNTGDVKATSIHSKLPF